MRKYQIYFEPSQTDRYLLLNPHYKIVLIKFNRSSVKGTQIHNCVQFKTCWPSCTIVCDWTKIHGHAEVKFIDWIKDNFWASIIQVSSPILCVWRTSNSKSEMCLLRWKTRKTCFVICIINFTTFRFFFIVNIILYKVVLMLFWIIAKSWITFNHTRCHLWSIENIDLMIHLSIILGNEKFKTNSIYISADASIT